MVDFTFCMGSKSAIHLSSRTMMHAIFSFFCFALNFIFLSCSRRHFIWWLYAFFFFVWYTLYLLPIMMAGLWCYFHCWMHHFSSFNMFTWFIRRISKSFYLIVSTSLLSLVIEMRYHCCLCKYFYKILCA